MRMTHGKDRYQGLYGIEDRKVFFFFLNENRQGFLNGVSDLDKRVARSER